MTILIVSSLDDAHAQAVMEELSGRRGVDVELLDLSEFPDRLTLSMTFDIKGIQFCLRRSGGRRLDLGDVTAVWWRRPQPFKLPSSLTGYANRQFALSESSTAFQGLYQSLDAYWINEPARDAAAAHKPWQLVIAREVGLEIPDTLMTNDPDEAQRFWRRFEGEVVFKQFLALPDTWRETRILRPEQEQLADSIRLAPVIFQRCVPGVADVRVTAVGDDLFASAAQIEHAEYPIDVRMNPNVKYAEHELPESVSDSLRLLMKRLGLVYGAIDLRLTPEGRYVFLEVNPAGQYLFVDNATTRSVTAAIAALLACPKLSQCRHTQPVDLPGHQQTDIRPAPVESLPASAVRAV